MYTVILKKKEEKKILNGFPWIYANEVSKILGKDKQGSVAKVCAFDGRFVCYGFINHLSKIIVRVATLKDEIVDEKFIFDKINAANEFRINLGYKDNYRVVFSESDMLSGLIVDKYGEYLSIQILSLAMEVRKKEIVDALIQIFTPKGIYERSDVAIRKKEGLEERKGWLYGEGDGKTLIEENGLKIVVDFIDGQKTGYFLDQKENRDNVKHYVKGKNVLDCFCNIGGFSLCSAKYGAKDVTSVDISDFALDYVRQNANLNGFNNIKTVKADVFETLREFRKEHKKYGVVILDPPAFTKTADTVKDAIKGYKDINISGLKLVEHGGYLMTCSCSQHLSVQTFLNVINESVYESGVKAKLVEFRTQGKDHACMIGSEQSLYLKMAILYIL
ncbi:MAG: class I SAM-dependent rRNA methyltransferase [Clostridia bacterium]|nr:class I SAM-dependent rRNA methyltransferase [Clostridia bacterium]